MILIFYYIKNIIMKNIYNLFAKILYIRGAE